jgi:hypothetical protein
MTAGIMYNVPSVEGGRRLYLEFLPRPQLAPLGGSCTPAETVFFTVLPICLLTARLQLFQFPLWKTGVKPRHFHARGCASAHQCFF